MPPLNKFTIKAREAIKKAHELAIERGQNHVSSMHLLTALLVSDESIVVSIIDRLELDTMAITDAMIESIEGTEAPSTISPSYQIYLNPDLAQVIEHSVKVAERMKDEFVSTEHLFLAMFDIQSEAKDSLARFGINK